MSGVARSVLLPDVSGSACLALTQLARTLTTSSMLAQTEGQQEYHGQHQYLCGCLPDGKTVVVVSSLSEKLMAA